MTEADRREALVLRTKAPGREDSPEKHELIPGAPADTVDVKILQDSVHLTAPPRDIVHVSSRAPGWPVKPDEAEANYELGVLRVEVSFKDPMEDAVKVAIKAGGAETKTKEIEG